MMHDSATVFTVKDVIESLTPRQPWGGTPMHVKDPGGNIISFVQAP